MSQSTQLSTFNFEQSSIRVIAVNNEPWFIAKDVCEAVNISNYRDAIERLDDDEKGVALTDTLGGQQEMNIISESGMYTLILRCRDAVKKGSVPHRFRKWVTAEVLPQIRKTGSYQRKTTVDERTGLRDAVNMLVSKRGLIYSEAYQMVHQRFNVQSIEDLTQEQLSMAVEYVHKICLEGELIIQDPKPTTHELSESELQDLAWCWFALERCTETLRLLYKPLHLLGADFAPTVYSQGVEYHNVILQTHKILKRLTEKFECDVSGNWRVLPKLRAFNPNAVVFNQVYG